MGELTDFSIAVEARNEHVVVHVHGELDMARTAAFEDALSSVRDAEHLVLDLSGCTLLDSAGVRVITATVRDAGRVSVVATEPAVIRVLELTAVDTLLTVHPSLDSAL